MSILLNTLMAPLARILGDIDSTNYRYSADRLFSALNDGVDDYNECCLTQQYSKSGTGDSETVSPTPTDDDKRLLVYYSALNILYGDLTTAAYTAYSHSNAAGRTDLSRIPENIEKMIERFETKINDIWEGRRQVKVEEELEEAGEELKGKPTATEEGLEIITIEKGV